MNESRTCLGCHREFGKKKRESQYNFVRRKYCSLACARLPLTQRFWSKVDIKGKDECWPWIAAESGTGYGQFGLRAGVGIRAHRMAFRLHFGIDPKRHFVLHLCNNPMCCNPHHLALGSHAQNMRHMIQSGHTQFGERHWASKLSWPQVLAIRQLYAGGQLTQRKLAKQFGLVQQHVSEIVRGDAWNPQRLLIDAGGRIVAAEDTTGLFVEAGETPWWSK